VGRFVWSISSFSSHVTVELQIITSLGRVTDDYHGGG
jgi:hypothetical protein